MQKTQSAFTLIELMIVVIILGIIAGFGIPNFSKSQARVVEKDGVYNLGTIASAMEMYRVRNEGDYPGLPGLIDTAEINTTLNLGIIEQGIAYVCLTNNAVNPHTFRCTASPVDYGWSVRVTESVNGVPFCAPPGTGCPTL